MNPTRALYMLHLQIPLLISHTGPIGPQRSVDPVPNAQKAVERPTPNDSEGVPR